MPSAQGHMTVRRRPKDGNDGNDAVRYWVVPSVNQVRRTQDGTLYPSKVTCEKRKQTGNSQPVATSEGTLYYQAGYEDGTVSAKSYYSTSGVNVTTTMAWIKFILEIGGLEVASENVTVLTDGEDAYTLDLDNEMQGIPCKSDGTPTGTGTLASTNSTVYRGSKIDSGWTFSVVGSSCTASVNANTGAVSVTAIAADKASVTVTATKGTKSLKAVMSLYKVKAGANGTTPIIYSIETSVSAIGRNASNELSPTSFTAYQNKTEGNSTIRTSDKTLKYKRVGQDTSEQTLSGQGGTIEGMTDACTSIEVKLYDGSTMLDSETIPIVKDGQNGSAGVSTILAVTTKRQYTLATWLSWHDGTYTTRDYWTLIENITDFKVGDIIIIPGIITDLDNMDCLSYWTVDEINVANKTVYCYATTTFIYGKKGDAGDDAVRYWLVPSVTSVRRSATGASITPSSVSCNVLKQVGDGNPESASDVFVIYNKHEGNTPFLQYTPGSSITVSTVMTHIEFQLYKTGGVTNGIAWGSGSMLDCVTIPIIADGAQGIAGKNYKPIRVRGWSKIPNGDTLTTGLNDSDDWTDIVYMFDEEVESGISYWQCIQNFTKASGQIPPDNNNDTGNDLLGKLKKTSNMATLATDIFLANYAVIRNLGVEAIEMRNADGVIQFMAKDGVVTCNTGSFQNVTVSGNLRASIMDFKVSTAEAGALPNGSLCFDKSSIKLPQLAPGYVRSIKLYNPKRTRLDPENLTLVPQSTTVKICTTETFDMAKSETKTLNSCGMNGGVYIELLGINLGGETTWTMNIQTITSTT